MSVIEKFSERLRLLRESKGLNQSQLAEKLGVSRGSISYYENKDRIPDIEFLDKTSKFFNVSYDFLLGDRSRSEKRAEQELGLSSEAIEAIELLSRTINIDSGVSMLDVLNRLLLNPGFEDLLFQLSAASNIDEDEAIRLHELTKKHMDVPIPATVKDASKLRESMTYAILSGIYDDFKNNPVKPTYQVIPSDDGVTILKKDK